MNLNLEHMLKILILLDNKLKWLSNIPVWVLLWILRFSLLAKTFPHPGNGQGKGFSPVCTRIWLTNLYLALNGRPCLAHSCHRQVWSACSGPPTWSTVRWFTISCIVEKILLQGFLGSCWSLSTHKHVCSCLMGCRMYLRKAPGPWDPMFMELSPPTGGTLNDWGWV